MRWQSDTEELSALRIRNITLESRIKALEDQLEDAKEHHTPVSYCNECVAMA